MMTTSYPKKNKFACWTAAAIKEYLHSGEKLTPQEVKALNSDRRETVQKLLFSYLQRQEKEEECKARLHRMSTREKQLHVKGYARIAGVDEAGRGPLAGPVVAAAVILDLPQDPCWQEINDSKQLSSPKREQLYQVVVSQARAFAIGVVSAALIDRLNIHRASLEAMRLAVRQLWPQPQFVLCDGFLLPGLEIPQEAVRGGDARCLSIAAASILAKVTRDRLMRAYEGTYPGYGFAQHKGYPTLEHRKALCRLGLSPIHRRSFKCI